MGAAAAHLGGQGLGTVLVGAHLCSSKRYPAKLPCPRKRNPSTLITISTAHSDCGKPGVAAEAFAKPHCACVDQEGSGTVTWPSTCRVTPS